MRTGKRLGGAVVAVAGLLPPAGPARADGLVKIGLVNSLFRDTPPSLVEVLSRPLKALMESQTGLGGALRLCGDATALAKQLKEGKVQLGVFHGFEFAWARQK